MSDSPEKTPARRPRTLKILSIAAALAIVLAALALVVKPFSGPDAAAKEKSGSSGDPYALTYDGEDFSGREATGQVRTQPVAQRDSEEKYASACASCAAKHDVAQMPAASTTTRVAKGATSSKQLKKLLKDEQRGRKSPARGDRTMLAADGSAIAPIGAPQEVQNVIAAANAIKNYPYIWGGGHGSFQASGYDCSGSVSYALKGADLIGDPMVSGAYENYGAAGPGKWITIYANAGHVFMIVGGLRFDTSFRDGPYGSRWQDAKRSMSGFVVRHPVGL